MTSESEPKSRLERLLAEIEKQPLTDKLSYEEQAFEQELFRLKKTNYNLFVEYLCQYHEIHTKRLK